MEAGVRTALYLGAVLLAGGGFFARWIAPPVDDATARRLVNSLHVGGGLIVFASLADVVLAVYGLQARLDLDLFAGYLGGSRHGIATLLRIGLVLLLLGSGLVGSSGNAVSGAAFAVAALGLFGTISWTSHAGAAGWGPLLADVVHLACAVGWGGALVYFAALPPRGHPDRLARAARRLSAVGAAGVVLLVGTGLYAAFVHLWGVEALTGTTYGRALLYKLGLVVAVWSVAAANRWRLLPTVLRGGSPTSFVLGVRAEAALLVAVFALTGTLTSQAPPERAEVRESISFEQQAGDWVVRGRLDPARGGFEIRFTARTRAGDVPDPSRVRVLAEMIGHRMPPVHVPVQQVTAGTFRGRAVLPMGGPWQMEIALPDGTARVHLLALRVEGVR
ncbi:MAG: CopD family protein [Armatimonadota bacterium]|nr:CopD family protein [Armatimonadota bacterium]